MQEILAELQSQAIVTICAGLIGLFAYYARKAYVGIRTIAAEFRPNGGGSMRDQISQLKEMVGRNTAWHWAVVDGMAEPMFEVNAKGEIVRVNRAMVELVGRGTEAFLGSEWENNVVESDRDRVWDAWADAIARGRTFDARFRICTLSGEVVDVKCHASPIRNGSEVSGWLGKYVVASRAAAKRTQRESQRAYS